MPFQKNRAAAACAALLALGWGAASADELRSKGDALHGTVLGIQDGKVRLKTVYGGDLDVPLADVESLSTEGSYFLFHGEDSETSGEIRGVEDGALLVGPPDRLERIPFGDLHAAVPEADVNGSTLALWKNRLRYWSATFDLGASYTAATTDTFTFLQALRVERKKSPTRLLLTESYRYGTEDKNDRPKSVNVNELRGDFRLEYDLTERLFAFATVDGEHNAIQKLSYRIIPAGGLGYKLYKSETTTFQVESGGAGIFERFYGGDREESASIVFGAELDSKLPYGAKFNARVDYLPSLDDWANDYLIRSKATLEYPLIRFVSVKLGVADNYDNTPAEDTDRNEFTTTAALSVGF